MVKIETELLQNMGTDRNLRAILLQDGPFFDLGFGSNLGYGTVSSRHFMRFESYNSGNISVSTVISLVAHKVCSSQASIRMI